MRKASICEWANNAGRASTSPGAPILSPHSSREALIAWLAWNDRNGCYTDNDARAEGMDPMTREEAWNAIERVKDDE